MDNRQKARALRPEPKERELLQTALKVLEGYDIPAQLELQPAGLAAGRLRADAVLQKNREKPGQRRFFPNIPSF